MRRGEVCPDSLHFPVVRDRGLICKVPGRFFSGERRVGSLERVELVAGRHGGDRRNTDTNTEVGDCSSGREGDVGSRVGIEVGDVREVLLELSHVRREVMLLLLMLMLWYHRGRVALRLLRYFR